MSLELSRRSFMKFTALTAVAVAGSSLLGGCSDGSDTLYPSGAFGKTLSPGGINEFVASNPAYSDGTFTCTFKATCKSTTALTIRAKFFQIEILRGKTTTKYNGESENCTLTMSQADYYLPKGDSTTTTMKFQGATLQDGDVISVLYFPRLESTSNGNGQAYTDLHATWKATYKNGAFV